MKREKTVKYVGLLCVFCLLLSMFLMGCGGGGGAAGRFAERELAALDDARQVLGVTQRENGDSIIYTGSWEGETQHVAANTLPGDGGALTSEACTWVNYFLAPGGAARSISETPDGTAYLLYNDEAGQYRLVRRQGGTVTPLEIDGWNRGLGGEGMIVSGGADNVTDVDPDAEEEAKGVSIGGFGNASFGTADMLFPIAVNALEDGGFLITYSGAGVHRHNAAGEKLLEYAGESFLDAAVFHKGRLAVPDMQSGSVIVYDLETGEKLESLPYEGDAFDIALTMDDSGLYAADTGGIHRLTQGGKETVVDGGLTSLMLPTYRVSRFLVTGPEEFFCLLSDDESSFAMQYAFDPTLPAAPDKELNIFSLYDSNTIRQAIGEFQRKNPDVRVNLNVALDENSGATREDVIRTLNTELLSGNGPDLIVLDGLPVASYIEKGVLKDISDLTERLVSSGGLMENLVSAYERDGKTYALPARFTLPVMLGDTDTLAQITSLTKLADLVELLQGETPMLLSTPEELWDENADFLMKYYDAAAGGFLNTDGSIDTNALAAFYSDMLRLDRTLKEHSPQLGDGLSAVFAVAAGGSAGFETLDIGSWRLRDGEALAHIQELVGMMGLRSIGGDLEKKPEMTLQPLFGEGLFYPTAGIGIAGGSKQAALAELFIETLFSESIQGKYLYDGFPVSNTALTAMLREFLKDEKPVPDMNFAALCEGLTTPVFVDEVVKSAVAAQAEALVAGAISPEEAAANVAEQTRLYLAE